MRIAVAAEVFRQGAALREDVEAWCEAQAGRSNMSVLKNGRAKAVRFSTLTAICR